MNALNEEQARKVMQATLAAIWKDRPFEEMVTPKTLGDIFSEKLREAAEGEPRRAGRVVERSLLSRGSA